MNWALVFLGGGIGAASRWAVSANMPAASGFPYSTLIVNLIGCFLIGLLYYVVAKGQQGYLLAVVGFLGGFTTFSSYGLELMRMLESGQAKNFMIYLLASNVLGILLVYIGYRLSAFLIT